MLLEQEKSIKLNVYLTTLDIDVETEILVEQELAHRTDL